MNILQAAVLLGAAGLFTAAPLQAATVKKDRIKFSATVLKDCLKNGGNDKACAALAIAADPPGDGITDLSMSLKYDPGRWTFDATQSGFLCDFSSGGGCPSNSVPTGSVIVADLPTLSVLPGGPLPGSMVSITDDTTLGVVTLNYTLSAPAAFSGEQNFFSFYFLAKVPFDATQTAATFHTVPGAYDFTQSAATCLATIDGSQENCGSDTPVEGIDLRPIPEPRLGAAILVLLAAGLWRRKSRLP